MATIRHWKHGHAGSDGHTCLLALGPQRVGDLLRLETTTELHSLTIFCDLDTTQLAHPDLYPMIQRAKGTNGPMATSYGKEWQTKEIGELDLC